MTRLHLFTLIATTVVLLPAAAAQGRVKLATLPARERVEIQLDNGNYTLVEEERIVTILPSSTRGNNHIDFSWSNTQIDKDSILFRPIAIRQGGEFRAIGLVDGKPEVSVINVAYPPGENALMWEVYANDACALKVRVSYLIANLGRSFSYRALADKDEGHLTLKKFIRLSNYSGEEFGTAGVYAGFGPRFLKEIGQQEDVRLLLATFKQVPIKKTFTFDWYSNGSLNTDKPFASKVLMHYQLVNDEQNKMGEFPLQPGKVRIFIQDGHGGEAFLGEDWAGLTPLDDKMRLYLGEARDVVCTRTLQDNRREQVRGNLFNQEIWIKYEVENFKDAPATLDIIEQINSLAREYGADPHGDAEWELGADTSSEIKIAYEKGHALPVLSLDLPARPEDPAAEVVKKPYVLHVKIKNFW